MQQVIGLRNVRQHRQIAPLQFVGISLEAPERTVHTGQLYADDERLSSRAGLR
jgi:hypothetical protein